VLRVRSTHAIISDKNLVRYHKRLAERFNNSRISSSLDFADHVDAHIPDLAAGMVAHSWRGPYMTFWHVVRRSAYNAYHQRPYSIFQRAT
jgi:hypothetical protein